MNDTLSTLVVTSLTAITLAIVAGYFSLRTKLAEQHKAMNSRLDELLVVTKREARAEGVVQGAADEKLRQQEQSQITKEF